ncbi:MAG: hypothetical protein EGR71_11820 [Clostridiales bacterium]|nr:hypothetical protein [Clostridiales bacterium]
MIMTDKSLSYEILLYLYSFILLLSYLPFFNSSTLIYSMLLLFFTVLLSFTDLSFLLLNKLNKIYPTINTLTNNKINIILFFFTLILHI